MAAFINFAYLVLFCFCAFASMEARSINQEILSVDAITSEDVDTQTLKASDRSFLQTASSEYPTLARENFEQKLPLTEDVSAVVEESAEEQFTLESPEERLFLLLPPKVQLKLPASLAGLPRKSLNRILRAQLIAINGSAAAILELLGNR